MLITAVELGNLSRVQDRIKPVNNWRNTNLVHGAGSLSHLTNRYLQTLKPYVMETTQISSGKVKQMSNANMQNSTYYLNTHFAPTFFNSIDTIIPYPFFRGIWRALFFVGSAHHNMEKRTNKNTNNYQFPFLIPMHTIISFEWFTAQL